MRKSIGYEGRRLVSAENIAQTRTPKVATNDKLSYALGWSVQQTPNGSIIWHNGGTTSFGSYIGFLAHKGVGVTVLTNEANVGFPDAVGLWVLDRVLDNPSVDHVAKTLEGAKAKYESMQKQFVRRTAPHPAPSRRLHPFPVTSLTRASAKRFYCRNAMR